MGRDLNALATREHYQALQNDPNYRMEFMMDVLREEMMMNMPRYGVDHEQGMPKAAPETPKPEWSRSQWDFVQQLQGRMLHLQGKVEELIKIKKMDDSY